MTSLQSAPSTNGIPIRDHSGRGETGFRFLDQASRSMLAFWRDERAAAPCARALGQLLDSGPPSEVKDAAVLSAVLAAARSQESDARGAFESVVGRYDESRNLAPAAVAQALDNRMNESKEDPGANQSLERFSAAFHLLSDLAEAPPRPGDEVAFLDELISPSTAHLACCEELASAPGTEATIARLLYTGNSLRPQWRAVRKVDPYAAELLQALKKRVPMPLSRWDRFRPYARPAAAAALGVSVLILGLAVVTRASRSASTVAHSAPVAPEPPSAPIPAGKKVVVVVSTRRVGPGALELRNRVDSLALGSRPSNEAKGTGGQAPADQASRPIVIDYEATPAATILRAADLNVPGALPVIVRLQEGKLLGGEFVLLARELGGESSASKVRMAVELIQLPTIDPAKPQEVSTAPLTLWSGLWEINLETPAEIEDITAGAKRLANTMAYGEPSAAVLAAETVVAGENPTTEDYLRAASVYIVQGNTPTHRSRAIDLLRKAVGSHTWDERLLRLHFAVETDLHRRVIQAHRGREVTGNRELERYQAAATEEHREAILKSWAINFLQGGTY